MSIDMIVSCPQPIEKPSLIQRKVIQEKNSQVAIVNDLIDEVKPSLIIFRDKEENKLLLEVTGIESPQRSEKLGRRVLNSIVWIIDDLENNEEILRKIAYSAIQCILEKDLTFSKMIEESIDFFELEEFRVNLNKIDEFIQQIISLDCLDNNYLESYQECKIEAKSTDNLEQLAKEILNTPLPQHWISWDGTRKTDGVLVVVTENLEERTILHKAGVWRGFASRVEEPARKSIQLPEKKTQTISSLELSQVENPQIAPQTNQKIRLIILLLIVAIIIMSVLVSLQLLFQPQPQQTPQLQTQPQQIVEPQPQPTQTPQSQFQQEKTSESPTKLIVEPQPQPTQTPQSQSQQERTSQTPTKLIVEP